MKKAIFTLSILLCLQIVQAQPWTYNFGTLTASYNATNQGSAVNAVMPFGPTLNTLTPMSGYVTNTVRIGTGGGTINLENQTISFGSGSYLRAQAASASSYNMMKFTGMAPGTNQFYLSFKMRLGNSTGNSDATITTGTWNLTIGNQFESIAYPYYSGTATPSTEACDMRWTLGASGAITFAAGGTSGTTTSCTGLTFSQGTDYVVEIYVNNSNKATAYSKNNGTSTSNYALAANTYDIWATPTSGNPTKCNTSNIAVYASAPALNGVLDSWQFFGASSTTPSNNSSNLFLDDLTYSNAIPSGNAPTVTNYYYSGSGNLDNVTSWTVNSDGSGAGTPANNPANFTTDYQVFNISNSSGAIASSTIGAAWTVSGNGSKVVVGDGINSSSFTIPSSFALTGLIDVSNNATLTITNNTAPTLEYLNVGSTVVYDGPGTQTVQSNSYGTLGFTNSTSGATPIRNFAATGPIEIGTAFNVGSFTYAATAAANNFSYGSSTTGGLVFYGTGSITVPALNTPNIVFANPNLTIAGNISFPATGTSGGLCNIYENISFPASKTLTYISTSGATAGINVAYNKTLSFAGSAVFINNNNTTTPTALNTGTYTYTNNTNNAGAVNFASGAQYTLAGNGGILPNGTWSTGSTCLISGITTSTSAIVNSAQTFSNLTWNCASQTTGTPSIAGAIINGTFNIVSTGSGAGTIVTGGTVKIAPGGAITGLYAKISGAVTIQQSMIAQRGYRVFANPFSTAQTNLSSTGLNATVTTANDVKTWDQTAAAWSSAGSGYGSVTIAGNQPYACFIRGASTDNVSGSSYTTGPTAFTYSVSGTLNGASTGITPANTSNYLIVGNPYAAPVNTQALTGQSSTGYYTYQINVSGNGQTKQGSWVASGGNSNTSNTIPVLGVVAYQPASTSTFNITTSDINTGGTAQGSLFGVEKPFTQMELLLQHANGDYADKLFVRLDASATNNGTDKMELKKLYNDVTNVYTIADDKNTMAIDARSTLNNIPMGISTTAGDYTFKLNSNSLPDGTTIYINDKYTNTKTELTASSPYNFSITSDAASQGTGRFELVFSNKSITTLTDPNAGTLKAAVIGNIIHGNTIALQIAGAAAPVNVLVKDISGKAISTAKANNGIQYINVGNTVSGMILLQISDGKSTIIQKVMKL